MNKELKLRSSLRCRFLNLLLGGHFLLAFLDVGFLLEELIRCRADLLTLGAVVLGDLAAGDIEGDGGAERLAVLGALAEGGADLATAQGLGHGVVNLDALTKELMANLGMTLCINETCSEGGLGDGYGTKAAAVEAEEETLLAAVLVGQHERLGADVADVLLVLLAGFLVGDRAGLQEGVDDVTVFLRVELVGETVVEDDLEVVTTEVVVLAHDPDTDTGVKDPFACLFVLHAAGNELYGLLCRLGDTGDLDGEGDEVCGLAGCELLCHLGIGFHGAARNFQC